MARPEPHSWAINLITSIARCILPVMVVFTTSVAGFLACASIAMDIGFSGTWKALMWGFVGFVGVTSGAFCLPRWTRLLASSIFLALGLLFYLYVRTDIQSDEADPPSETWWTYTQFLPLAVGGFLSVAIFFFSPNATIVTRRCVKAPHTRPV